MSSKLIESGNEQEIKEEVKRIIRLRGSYSKFVFGCGVVSYNTSPERMLKLKQLLRESETEILNRELE